MLKNDFQDMMVSEKIKLENSVHNTLTFIWKHGGIWMSVHIVYIKNSIINHEVRWLPTRGEREQRGRKMVEARLS